MKQPCPSRVASRTAALAALAALLAACGGGEEQAGTTPTGQAPAAAGPAAAPESPEDKRLANAVVTGKTAAAVDLKYDIQPKPEPNQAFEIELTFLPRLAADVMEFEATGIPGLAVESGASGQFTGVSPGDRHTARVLVRAAGNGLYYIGVTAKMQTKIQTDVRTFSVPVVVGTVDTAAQKTAPQQDASGQAHVRFAQLARLQLHDQLVAAVLGGLVRVLSDDPADGKHNHQQDAKDREQYFLFLPEDIKRTGH